MIVDLRPSHGVVIAAAAKLNRRLAACLQSRDVHVISDTPGVSPDPDLIRRECVTGRQPGRTDTNATVPIHRAPGATLGAAR